MNNQVIAFLEIWFGGLLCAVLTAFARLTRLLTLGMHRHSPTKKLVFVKFIEQGALVLHLNTFSEAVKRYDRKNTYIVTFESNEPLITLLDVFATENCIYLSEKSIGHFAISFWVALHRLHQQRVDSVIDLEFFSRATAIFSYLTGATKRVGYHRYDGGQNYRGDLFTHKLSYSHYLSVGDTSWSMLECLSRTPADLPSLPQMDFPDGNVVSFAPTESDMTMLAGLFPTGQLPGKMIIINPSFQDVLPLRAWPVENYKAYVSRIVKELPGYTLIFTGKANEADDTNIFMSEVGITDAVNLCGRTTLRALFTLYTQAHLLLTSDSGPGHFASVTGIPSVVLFGPETPILYAPRADNIHVLFKSLPCSPCYNVYNNRTSACQNNQCLKAISVEEVVQLSLKVVRP